MVHMPLQIPAITSNSNILAVTSNSNKYQSEIVHLIFILNLVLYE